MSLTTLKLTSADFPANIQSLPDKVQNQASFLKEAFDHSSESVLMPRINAILDLLIASGSVEIGATAIYEGDTVGTIQSKLDALYTALQSVVLGGIPDGSITKAKLESATAAGLLTFGAAAPTVGDDSADGYQIGSLWMNTTTLTMYICSSAAAGAAVWDEFKSGASGLVGSSTFNGVTGRVITHNIGSTDYAISITPTADTEAKTGEVYVTKAANTVTVHNTGTYTGAFDYMVMEA